MRLSSLLAAYRRWQFRRRWRQDWSKAWGCDPETADRIAETVRHATEEGIAECHRLAKVLQKG